MWSLLSTVGVISLRKANCVMYSASGSPRVLPSAGSLVSEALEGQGKDVSVSKSSVRVTVVHRRHHLAEQAIPQHPLQPSPIIFPIVFWEPTTWLFFVTFHDEESWEEDLAPVFPDQSCLERSGWNYLIQQISPQSEHQIVFPSRSASSVKSPL